MKKKINTLGLVLGIAVTSNAMAAEACPPLPQNTELAWEESGGSDFKVCRAIDAEGTQLLGVMFSTEPKLNPRRRNRVEEGRVGNHEVHWYRPEIAQPGAAEKRITVIELGKNRYAQIWLDANDPDQLRRAMDLARKLPLY